MSDAALPAPPPGWDHVGVTQTALTFCLLGAFFGGLLVPLFVFLLLFSKPVTRRHPVFIINLAIVVLGLALAAINVGQEWTNLVTPIKGVPTSLTLANIALNTFPSMIIDSVLLFRLLAFYPSICTPRRTYFIVLAFPITVKCARLTCVTLFLYNVGRTSTDGPGDIFTVVESFWYRNPYLVAEWSLQIADNLYCTLFFLWKLRKFYNGEHNRRPARDKTLLARLRSIFAIALANFVFPLFMNVAQLILVLRDVHYPRGSEVLISNLYVAIIGLLFATVWAGGNAWGRDDQENDQLPLQAAFQNPGFIEIGPRMASRASESPKHRDLSLQGQGDQSGPLAPNRILDIIDIKRATVHDEINPGVAPC
ncbi:hypothetical protein DXG01_001704 [Tephrocybe rancida]|nr:hypothetical protein DXG01_001704 [Tephrocybe rancida]